MPEVTATRSVDLPLGEIWTFVEDFDNWAPMLMGYVAHEKASERDSVWTLRGDLGPFSKTVKVDVHITEWAGPNKVAFTLTGIDEDVSGTGAFTLTEDRPELPEIPRSLWARLLDWLLGREAPATEGSATSHVVFTFGIEAGGPMGPMINALLGPWTEKVAHALLDSVGTHLETP